MKHLPKQPAFTLAELLIALAILGVIATFTIPKILDSGSNNQYNAMAKEAAAIMTGAYQQLKLNGTVSAQTNSSDLTPYINYVLATSAGEQLQVPWGIISCTAATPCYQLHNGGWIRVYEHTQREFGGTTATNIISMQFDPDGTGQDDGINFWLFYSIYLR